METVIQFIAWRRDTIAWRRDTIYCVETVIHLRGGVIQFTAGRYPCFRLREGLSEEPAWIMTVKECMVQFFSRLKR